MWWLIAILVLIAAFAVPRFGKAVLVVVGLATLGLLLLYLRNEREGEEARKRVRPQEVELSDLRLTPAYGTSYNLVGRVRNASSKFSIQSLQLRIVLRDCVVTGGCETVGDETESILVDVPPGQTRAIDQSVSFSGIPGLKGSSTWHYTVMGVRAE